MTVRQAHDLKGLKTRLTMAQADLDAAQEQVKDAQRKEAAARRLRDSLKDQITNIETANKEPVVTEHALLRYLERVYGIDLEETKRTMLDDGVADLIKQFKSGKIPSNGCRLIVKDCVVVTVEPPK